MKYIDSSLVEMDGGGRVACTESNNWQFEISQQQVVVGGIDRQDNGK